MSTRVATIGVDGATGATGPQGPAGADGLNGASVLSGAIAPTVLIGNNGDFYLNTSTSELYGPKTILGWGSPVSLVGPTGATGATGPAGPSYALVDPASVAAASTSAVTRNTSVTATTSTKFKCAYARQCTGGRFYVKGASNETVTVTLWNLAGTQLAQKSVPSVTGTGYFQATFDTPVNLTADTIYVIGMYIPNVSYTYGGSAIGNMMIASLDVLCNGPVIYDARYTSANANTFPDGASVTSPATRGTIAPKLS